MAGVRILALDGHDAAGKTTLARRLADRVGAAYVTPFAGAIGAQLLAVAARDPDEAVQFARNVIAEAIEMARGDVLVFDRHWMTVCSLVPEPLWSRWTPVPPTALCWADLPTTLTRLAGRDEPEDPVVEHSCYLQRYWELGRRFHCLVVRTDRDSEDCSLARLLEWSASHLSHNEV